MSVFWTFLGDGLPVLVEYETTEGQKLIIYPVDDAQEGIEPENEVQSVTSLGYDISSVLNAETIDALVQQCDKHVVATQQHAREFEAEQIQQDKQNINWD